MKRICPGMMFLVAGISTCLLFSSYTRDAAYNMEFFRWIIGTWESPRKAGPMQETRLAYDQAG